MFAFAIFSRAVFFSCGELIWIRAAMSRIRIQGIRREKLGRLRCSGVWWTSSRSDYKALEYVDRCASSELSVETVRYVFYAPQNCGCFVNRSRDNDRVMRFVRPLQCVHGAFLQGIMMTLSVKDSVERSSKAMAE